jgi:16S rRNA (adenine1518-N6/adenine1519-N6)-dimethyltransferase
LSRLGDRLKHIHPIKRLGQSFLTYEPAADAIVAALDLNPEDEVLEIGPGKGILTTRLVKLCRRVFAVEIDSRLVRHLRDTLAVPNLEVLAQDVLELDFAPFPNVKVCGNLPYNISSQILFRLLDNLASWQSGVFTLQREFALRVLGQPGTRDYGALSVLFELDLERRRLFNLPPDYFKPSPDVTSTVISLKRRTSPAAPVRDRIQFVRVVKAAFAQRRKNLANNLSQGLGLAKASLARVEAESGIAMRRRAETLTLAEFARLAEVVCAS